MMSFRHFGRLTANCCRARTYSTTVKSFFELFPKTFPEGGPPHEPFSFRAKDLRREFRLLQSVNHPDRLVGSKLLQKDNSSADTPGAVTVDDNLSAVLNKAYSTIQNPYTRIAHIIELHHPDHMDITQDDVAKSIVAQMQQHPEASAEYKEMLMTVLEAHETLEFAATEADLDPLSEENDERIRKSESDIQGILEHDPVDWERVMIEAIRLKYWINIKNGIKDWEPGKPVHLTH